MKTSLGTKINIHSQSCSEDCFTPSGVFHHLPQDDKKRVTHSYYRITYPILWSEVDELELEIGAINYSNEVLKPSKIKLKKVKGTWYFNGFTV